MGSARDGWLERWRHSTQYRVLRVHPLCLATDPIRDIRVSAASWWRVGAAVGRVDESCGCIRQICRDLREAALPLHHQLPLYVRKEPQDAPSGLADHQRSKSHERCACYSLLVNTNSPITPINRNFNQG